MKKTVEAFLKSADISSVSLLSYGRDLQSLSEHFTFDLDSVNREALVSFFHTASQKLSVSSFTRLVSVSRSYFSYLSEKGILKENPMAEIRAKDFSQKEKPGLTQEECERLISYSVPGFRGIRDRVMLSLLSETGIRVSELVSLDRGDINGNCLSCGESHHRRVLTLSPALSRKVAEYMTVSALYLPDCSLSSPLFITAKGGRLTRQGFWKNLKDRAIYCGIDKPISPHALRRFFAVKLLSEGKDREEVRQKLGNADTASLRGYQQK